MKLENILKGTDAQVDERYHDLEINKIAYDSRKAEKNSMFIAISGYKTDGHRYIKAAIEKGAKAVVYEQDMNWDALQISDDVAIIKTKDSRKLLSKASDNFFGHPTKNLHILGVTGTNGKTTITHLVYEILRKLGHETALLGTISYKIADKEYDSSNTTPESFELHRMFKEMIEKNIKWCSMEVSSHALALKRVDSIDFDYCIFTNLTVDHLDFHGDLDDYFNVKKTLFYKSKEANIINSDDPYGQILLDEVQSLKARAISYGIDKAADYRAIHLKMTSLGATFDINCKGEIIEGFSIPIPGKFSIYNALAVIAFCHESGIEMEIIQGILKNVTPVPGRFEPVKNGKGYNVIVDYAHTPDSLEKVLHTIMDFKKGRILTVFGCGGDRDNSKRSMMGKIAGELSDYCIITSDNPRSEDPLRIIKHVEEGIKHTNCPYEIIEDRRRAIKRAIDLYQKDDTLLIAGKGHETYQIIGDQTFHFDDREEAAKRIAELG
jgi:UDP-N-acetylmuramoyl-L-alanyl-D-glutamate--2,6-diaminopimelate ligase